MDRGHGKPRRKREATVHVSFGCEDSMVLPANLFTKECLT